MSTQSRTSKTVCSLILVFAIQSLIVGMTFADADLAKGILDATGVKGGFIVHVGAKDGRLTAALRANQRYQVHGLDVDAANVAKSRAYIKSVGLYGNVSVDRLSSQQLPYIDNLVNLIVAEDLGGVSMDEVLRVLAPEGVAYIKSNGSWQKTIKPRPDNIDEWTHYMHDASGNAVAHDDVVGPPRHLQWLGSPRWSRHHDRMASMSALVSAGGRIFYIMDEGSRISIQMPPKWTLIARDAFNGTVLWKQPIGTWQNHLWPLKSGPTALARRLVTNGDRVYVTLGITAPLSALDAATGEVFRTYKETAATEELVEINGTLLMLVNKEAAELANFAPQFNTGDQARVRTEYGWNEKPRQVMAIDADTGKVLWSKDTKVAPLTLSSNGEQALFHDGEKVVCLNLKSGDEVWTSEAIERRPVINMNFGPKLVIYKDVVLFAGGDRKMRGLSIKTGKEIWNAPHPQSGYQSPEDLLVSGGLIWSAPTTRTQDTGVFTGRDPLTGEVQSEFKPNVETYWFHHRCYIAKGTDKYLLPSRTGIEFVDHQSQNWDINHWVRGGCLYGIMPCNGLTYAPPHNCACYPEAKLYGLNALAPTSPTRTVAVNNDNRLETGPAFDPNSRSAIRNSNSADWPTYRHDTQRTGSTTVAIPNELKVAWDANLGGRLSAPTIADGKLFVAHVDSHTVLALDENSGKPLWNFTTGGRVDSPPTFYNGSLMFGSADGWVYCLQASNGELKWRFRAAPEDRRLMSFEQLESVWPVHGSVLVQENIAYFVAGRSNFLDGGLHFFRLNATSGELLSDTEIDEKNPDTGQNIQEKLEVLQMPVGLPDILSSDGKNVFMRSQQFSLDGERLNIGPHSGQFAIQGSVQKGETAHIFAPMGFLDDTYFHRAYWVYGRSFAGGHGGYQQAGQYAPSGRLLVMDDENVYGFGRKPEYLKWTTTIEHQMFSSSRQHPEQAIASADDEAQKAARRGGDGNMIGFEKSKSLNPTDTPLAMMAWVNAEQPNGVIAAHGGPAVGYALTLKAGVPNWTVRTTDEQVVTIKSKKKIVGTWTHVAGVLTNDKIHLYINGALAASADAHGLLASDPAQGLEIGGDDGTAVGDYKSPNSFMGTIDEFRLYHGLLTAEEIKSISAVDADRNDVETPNADIVLVCTFDNGKARDESGHNNHGTLEGNRATEGQVGQAIRFRGNSGAKSGGSFVKHHWTKDVPVMVRAMVKAADTIVIVGPPDLIDEEQTFQRLVSRDPKVQALLNDQDAALDGKQGAILRAMSAKDGSTIGELKLSSLPVWDGLAAANGRLYLTTEDGRVLSFAK